MNKKEYVADKTIEAMLQASASESESKIVDNLLEGFKGEIHNFSPKHNDDMQVLFKKVQRIHFYQKLRTYSKRAAMILAVVIAISTVTISSVSALRIRFMNFILEMTPYDTDIKFNNNALDTDNYKFGEVVLEYVPEGFVLEKNEPKGNYIYLKFVKDQEFFNFSTLDVNGSLSIDTENANVKEILINGRKALYSENSNNKILVWNDDETAYILTGNISENEFVKIAEKIKR